MHLFERQGDREKDNKLEKETEVIHPLVYSPNAHGVQAVVTLKLPARDSSHVSHMTGRNSVT